MKRYLQGLYKKSLLRFIVIIFAIFFISHTGIAQKLLFLPTTDTSSLVKDYFDSTRMGPKINIKFDPDILKSNSNNELVITLPVGPGTKRENVIIQKKRQVAGKDHFSWLGIIRGQPGSFVLITQVGKVFAGQIRTGDNKKLYGIEFVGSDVHVITQIRQDLFKPDFAKESKLPSGDNDVVTPGGNVTCLDADTIDVLVVYTKKAKRNAGSVASILAQIHQSLELTNQSFLNSGINAQVRLVHTAEINYQENRGIIEAHNVLQAGSDRVMGSVHDLRERYLADVVLLFLETGGTTYTGMANIMTVISPAFESMAFAVVERNASYLNLTVAHELGHIMGGRHQCQEDNEPYPFPYAHGFGNSNFKTIMYNTNVANHAMKVEYWSDPEILYPITREPTGSLNGTCQSNDAECLRQTIATISQFRCKYNSVTASLTSGSPVVDPGPEPDPDPDPDPEKREKSVTSGLKWYWWIIGILLLVLGFFMFARKKKREEKDGS